MYLLSQGDIDIQGTIDVSGQSPPGASGGAGGPGGFDGGRAGSQPGNRPNSVDYVYTMLHLVGGRGGPGNGSVSPPTCGGGGGGGALLLASNTRVIVDGTLAADSGTGICPQPLATAGSRGVAGNLRVVAPSVVGSGTLSRFGNGNATITRIDALYSEAQSWTVVGATTNHVLTEGVTMVARLPTTPRARIISVAGQAVSQETGPVAVTIPNGSPRTQDVVIDVLGYAANGTVTVFLEQQRSGGSGGVNNLVVTNASLDLSTGNRVTIPVTFEPLTGTWLDVVVRR